MQKIYTNVGLMATPTKNEHIVHKKYVDDAVEKRVREVVAAIAAQNPGLNLDGIVETFAGNTNAM